MWNPLAALREKIQGQGGYVNTHAHFDRAYSVLPEDFLANNVNQTLQQKWGLVDKYKSTTSESMYFEVITAALRQQKAQGVQACLSFIDCDPIVTDKALNAAIKAKEYAAKELKMRFLIANQTLKGVLDKDARYWFDLSSEKVDILGGLPGKDFGREAEHLDIILSTAKKMNKYSHIHVDQNNIQTEKETELLAKKVMEHGMEGKVSAVHGISIAAHPKQYRQQVYQWCKEANLSFIACPGAWIDARRNEELTPTHNAVTPLDELFEVGVTVALGSDNIADVYKPFADGSMEFELRLLLEANHFYNTDAIVNIATANGFKVLGLSPK